MKWNDKTVKAIVFNRERAQREQQTLSPREIVKNPIGKEVEVIVMALCRCVDELVEYKEAELERIGELQKQLTAKKLDQMELPLG